MTVEVTRAHVCANAAQQVQSITHARARNKLCLDNLQAVLLLELNVLLVEGVDTVNHDLDQLHLGVAETVLVGDVVGVA